MPHFPCYLSRRGKTRKWQRAHVRASATAIRNAKVTHLGTLWLLLDMLGDLKLVCDNFLVGSTMDGSHLHRRLSVPRRKWERVY